LGGGLHGPGTEEFTQGYPADPFSASAIQEIVKGLTAHLETFDKNATMDFVVVQNSMMTPVMCKSPKKRLKHTFNINTKVNS
jgi:hypothetical protein